MLGIPGETREDAFKTMRMVKYTKRLMPSISFYAPYPGSALGNQLIAEGKANKETAAELGICLKTVEKHRAQLMEKLDIHDTAGLTRYAISAGIIESSVQLTTV